MLNIGSMALLGILCTGIAASSAWAEEEKPTADLSVSALSKYVWRGFELSKDSLVLQPSMTVGYKGFSFNLWGNLDTDEHDFLGGVDENSSSWNETDMTIAYNGSCSFADYGIGLIYYAVDGYQDTQEIFVSVGLKTLLTPTLTMYRDYDAEPGVYLSLGISHSFAVTADLSLDLGAQIGYLATEDANTINDTTYSEQVRDANGDWQPTGEPYREFHDGKLSASMTFPLGDYFSLTPELYYSFPLSSKAKDLIESKSATGDDSDFVYGGVTLSMSF
jgi:hypothetical protein